MKMQPRYCDSADIKKKRRNPSDISMAVAVDVPQGLSGRCDDIYKT